MSSISLLLISRSTGAGWGVAGRESAVITKPTLTVVRPRVSARDEAQQAARAVG